MDETSHQKVIRLEAEVLILSHAMLEKDKEIQELKMEVELFKNTTEEDRIAQSIFHNYHFICM